MNSLNGKTALVTGGGSGIGKAIVKEMTSMGVEVFIHYHSSQQSAEELVSALKKRGVIPTRGERI